MAEQSPQLALILFTDIVRYTAFMGKMSLTYKMKSTNAQHELVCSRGRCHRTLPLI